MTAVVGSKEHGLYISASPSSAARKIVKKLCTSSKSKKVEFCVREITQGSKKKTYGPYLGEMKKNKVIVHLKKDKLNKIIKGGRVERFGIIEPTDFIQRELNNSQFAVIRKNYFRKPYLFFNPIKNPISGTTYYNYMAYETFLFRKPIIKQIKKNNIEDIDIMRIEFSTLEKLQKFIEQNNIFSKLNEKIKRIIIQKKDAISQLKNKQHETKLQKRIQNKYAAQAAVEAKAAMEAHKLANITPKQLNASVKQQAQQEPQEIIFSNNSTNNKIIETKTEIKLDSFESFKSSIHSNFLTKKPYHTSKNNSDIIIKKYKQIYYIFFIIERLDINYGNGLFYRYVVYYKDLKIKFKKLNDDKSIQIIDIKSINIEILLFLLNFLDKTLNKLKKEIEELEEKIKKLEEEIKKLNTKDDKKLNEISDKTLKIQEINKSKELYKLQQITLTNIRNFVLEEVKIKLKELYSLNNVNYTKFNYSIFENMNNMSNTERLIKNGFFIQNLNKNNNNIVITNSDIRGKIWKMGDTTYIFFRPIQLLKFKTENAYYYNYCVYLHSGYVKFKKVYKDEQSKIITEDIDIKEISSEDLDKLIDFILYRQEYHKYKEICDYVIKFIIDIGHIDKIDTYTLKKLKEFFNKEKTEKQKNLPEFYETINKTLINKTLQKKLPLKNK
jgi:predicted nuclease with TOPRIM domain